MTRMCGLTNCARSLPGYMDLSTMTQVLIVLVVLAIGGLLFLSQWGGKK
jgi:hypothetical protein